LIHEENVMRRLMLLVAALFAIAVAVGIGTALGVHWAGLAKGVSVSIDGDLIEGSGVAIVLGIVAAIAVSLACVVGFAVLASLAIVVPLAIVFVVGGVLLAVVVGLSPILVPVLLVVGACVLLSRRSRRRLPAATPDPTRG
jgi:hypothetical protein